MAEPEELPLLSNLTSLPPWVSEFAQSDAIQHGVC
jgi:hypothetical protein